MKATCITCGRDAEAEVDGRPYCHTGIVPTHYQLALYEQIRPTSTWLQALSDEAAKP